MGILRNIVSGLVVDPILVVAPIQRGPVQVCDVPEHTTDQEVLLDKPNRAFHLTLGKGVPGLTELCPEPDSFHKGLVILLPDGISLKVPVEDHAFHVVGQNAFGDSHIGEAVDHANKQILLSGIGKEFHIPLTAVVADHGKTGRLIFTAVIIHHIGEAQSI